MSESKERVFEKGLTPFQRLVTILAVLRSDDGCAWDRKQTHESLLPYLIEESYEVAEAIETKDDASLREELGDLICQIVFHSQLASERKAFDIDDAVTSINEKLIRRHPHVFGERRDLNPRQVRDQWEKIKIESGEKESVLSGIPRSMPALTMAFRIGEKAGGVGFDWKKAADVLDKIDEELVELKAEIISNEKERLADEIGDLLFAISSLARKLEINPELALKRALQKFSDRFGQVEKAVRDSGRKFGDYSLEELETIWQDIKR
ncbi:MAG TPA: nucleoside triphosphate pyrophosphohydrolase [candidate division Zixibacteria bacterium]|nr:nucleoside triphosphate pyrophosphohydrolase [candidate division Zixibacteria bacterium]